MSPGDHVRLKHLFVRCLFGGNGLDRIRFFGRIMGVCTSAEEDPSMQTKLTIRLEESLVRRAKSYARRSGKSLSALVADFFALLGPTNGAKDEEELTPAVRSLVGILSGAPGSEKDYRRYLEEKHS
jgi:hypothetical protein